MPTYLPAITVALAKALVKNLAGDTFVSQIAPDLLNVLKEIGVDHANRAKTQKQIESLATRSVESAAALFERERVQIPENSQKSIAIEAAQAITSAHIDADLLVGLGLDSDRLAAHLLGVRDISRQPFSSTELAFYNTIIRIVSQKIIEIAVHLDSFTRVVFAETLDRQSDLLEMVTRLVAAPDKRSQEFESRYCAHVRSKLDRLDLFGVRRPDEAQRSQSLSISYIELTAATQRDLPNHRWDEQTSIFDLSAPTPPTTDSKVANIDRFLLASRRLVVRGDAGSGKTTLLQWLAVRSAAHDFPLHLTGWNNKVPFFIRLREHVGSGFPTTENFSHAVAPMLSGSMPHAWVHNLLESGRALILVDGVDELPRVERNGMLERLAELVSAYPYASYIISSRPYAVKEESWPEWQQWIEREKFLTLNLQPMGLEQINHFVDHWHRAVAELLSDPEEIVELNQLAPGLKRLLRTRPALRRLANTPLLLAMICALHRDRRQRLPSERLELYKECCDMLLAGRDDVRRIWFGSDYPDISEGQKRVLAQNFAYWMMQNGWSDVEVEIGEEYFESRLRLMLLSENITGEMIRRWFVERTNLLREPVHGRIDFRHRTFQEYLGAQAAIREGDIGVLIKNATDDQWRELIILAAGLAGPRECERLLLGLIRRGEGLKKRKKQVHLLALACLETALEVRPEVRQTVITHAARFFPPGDPNEAPVYAAAGDPAVPLLIEVPEDPTAQCASVRTLSYIGTEQALAALAQFSEKVELDWSNDIHIEITRAWENFDRVEYARRVLKNVKNLLITSGLPNFDGFEHLDHLTGIRSDGGFPFENLGQIPCASQLTNLLILNMPPTKSLAPITCLTSIQDLFLWGGFEDVTSVEPISKLSALRELSLGEFRSITEIDPLTRLGELRRLWLLWCPALIDLKPIADLKLLENVSLSGCRNLKDFSFLRGLRNLRNLDLSNTTVDDLSHLAPMRNLTELYIRRVSSLIDLNPLQELKNLRAVDFSDCSSIQNLDILATLPHLTSVTLRRVAPELIRQLQSKATFEIVS